MTKTSIAIPLFAAVLTVATGALAKDITESKTITRPNGTKIVDRTTLNTRTDVVTETSKITRTDGQTKTVDARVSPSDEGGFTVSRTVTGFDGQTRKTTDHVGGGKRAGAATGGGKKG